MAIIVVESILCEDEPIAIFNDGFTGHEDIEGAIKGVMDAKLMAV